MHSQVHVLLVDDCKDQNVINAARFRNLGCSVSIASNFAEAIRAACEAPPDLLVVDYRLQGTTGPQLIVELRRSLGRLPYCVILSGHDVADLRIDLEENGVRRVLKKPLGRGDLEKLMAESLEFQESLKPPEIKLEESCGDKLNLKRVGLGSDLIGL